MKIALLTSDSLRHKYIANALAENLDLRLIITEKKSVKIEDGSSYNAEDKNFLMQHFKKRQDSEERFFEDYKHFPKEAELLQIEHGKINSEKVSNTLKEQKLDYIILFGTSILGQKTLNEYPDRIINLHLGLSPYYRGSATNLFPYLFEEPECIGATFHLASSKVDQGAILKQFRPEIKLTDDLHEIGNKVISAGGKLLPEVLLKYDQHKLQPKKQGSDGKVFRNKDLTPDKLRDIYLNFEKGMINEYLRDKETRDKKKPIFS